MNTASKLLISLFIFGVPWIYWGLLKWGDDLIPPLWYGCTIAALVLAVFICALLAIWG